MKSKRGIGLSRAKAKELLKEYRSGKKTLSASQIALFELVAHGKKPTRLKNPRLVEIAPRVDAILYSFKGKPHGDCDAECKRAGHRYKHDFEEDFPLCWDTATGRLLI